MCSARLIIFVSNVTPRFTLRGCPAPVSEEAGLHARTRAQHDVVSTEPSRAWALSQLASTACALITRRQHHIAIKANTSVVAQADLHTLVNRLVQLVHATLELL